MGFATTRSTECNVILKKKSRNNLTARINYINSWLYHQRDLTKRMIIKTILYHFLLLLNLDTCNSSVFLLKIRNCTCKLSRFSAATVMHSFSCGGGQSLGTSIPSLTSASSSSRYSRVDLLTSTTNGIRCGTVHCPVDDHAKLCKYKILLACDEG